MRIKVLRFVRAICFLMAAVLMVYCINSLFKPKWLENRWEPSRTTKSFYDLGKNSTDVVFFGTSQVAAAIDPYQLYEEYGISAYNLGIMSQPIQATYYWLQEALKTQDIKVAVIEVKAMARTGLKDEEKARRSYDYMRDNYTKLQYALDYNRTQDSLGKVKEEVILWDYLFPLSIYHSRWSELDYDDYDYILGNNHTNTRGFATLTTKFRDNALFDIGKYEKGSYDGFKRKSLAVEDVHKIIEEYDIKLLDYARDNGISLLFVKTPDLKWNSKQYNYVKNLADKYEIEFIDFNRRSTRAESGYDFVEDEADGVHVNMNGAKIITGYLGRYLKENYELTDYRTVEGPVKEEIEAGLDNYHMTLKDASLHFEKNLEQYLDSIDEEEYAVIMAAGSNVAPVVFSEEQKEALAKFGIGEDLYKETEYGAEFICVSEGGVNKFSYKEQKEELNKTIHEGGSFSDGTDYSIDVMEKSSSIRFNDNEFALFEPTCFNIIVYNKKLHEVADSVYLYMNESGVAMGRKEL